MSELINIRDSSATIRWKLLTSASALVLTVTASSINVAKAEDADRPLIWVELGGLMDNISGQGEVFAPAFLAKNPTSPVLMPTTPLQAQKPPAFSFGEEASITFQPSASDWVVSVGVNYGRSGNTRHVDHQVSAQHYNKYVGNAPSHNGNITSAASFADTHTHRQQSHIILDFSTGRDVGVGMFGRDGASVLSVGVRIAQFGSSETFDVRALPDLQVKFLPSAGAPTRIRLPYFNTYHSTGQSSRSFRGIGPSLSWNGSAPFVGNRQDGEITFDWGINAALLFGKQKAHVRHQEVGNYKAAGHKYYSAVYQHPPADHDTFRSVTVQNVGGFAGASYRLENFKVSMGYRADFFLGAMDVGIDARKSGTLGFKGPFASVSVALGD